MRESLTGRCLQIFIIYHYTQYRTNNISTLEKKNLGLFLNHVATHDDLMIKRSEVFPGKNEQVFRKFEDFHIALAGLAKISEKLEKKRILN